MKNTQEPEILALLGTELGSLVMDVVRENLQWLEATVARAEAAHGNLFKAVGRYLEVLERAEAEPELWARLTAGTGIATLNGLRHAISKAPPEFFTDDEPTDTDPTDIFEERGGGA